MRGKKLLAGLLVGVMIVCLVSVAGYGEIKQWMYEEKASYIEFALLRAQVIYLMHNPTNFLNVLFHYDPNERLKEVFPEDVDIEGKICVFVWDTRGEFSDKSGVALLEAFKRQLVAIHYFIKYIATDMRTDIVAIFYSKGDIPLGYFYQGEYHLWEE